MIRAYIIITLNNNSQIKYVRDVVADTNGVAKEYYAYTGNAGATYTDQTGAGRVKGDYETLVANLGTALAATLAADKLLKFPESGGSTSYLVRRNKDMSADKDLNNQIVIPAIAVASIKVVQEDFGTQTTFEGKTYY
jgi:hypothetical protein